MTKTSTQSAGLPKGVRWRVLAADINSPFQEKRVELVEGQKWHGQIEPPTGAGEKYKYTSHAVKGHADTLDEAKSILETQMRRRRGRR